MFFRVFRGKIKSIMKTKLKIIAVFTFAIFACFFFANSGNTQTKDETAGQRFKSIKVLNDMPADQMGKVMNMMSASLGVDCKFCHASNDGDYEKEGFEHKDMARKMLKMTFDLNKNYFEGKHFATVEVKYAKQTGAPQAETYFHLTMSHVFITSMGNSKGEGSLGFETITLTAEQYKQEYFAQGADGGITSVGSTTYNEKTGVSS